MNPKVSNPLSRSLELWLGAAIWVALLGHATGGDLSANNVTVSNRLTQMDAGSTNTFSGHLKAQGGLTVSGPLYVPEQGDISMGSFTNGPSQEGFESAVRQVPVGYIKGCWATYSNSTTVVVSPGEGYCNGHYFSITNAIVHTMTSLATAFDFHYVYIDDSASTYPNSVTIIDSATEPARSASKQGWYNGADRCVGVVMSPDSSATVRYFSQAGEETYTEGKTLAWCMNPSGSWQTPTSANGDTATPVNAIAIYVRFYAQDMDTDCRVYAAAKEAVDAGVAMGEAGAEFSDYGYIATQPRGWVPLGASRRIRIGGQDNDENWLCCVTQGWRIER